MHGDESNTVRTTISAACVANTPSLAVAPAAQSVTAGGADGTAPYTVYVTNNDSLNCPAVTFGLSFSDSNATDFNASSLSTTSLVVSPGRKGTATLNVSAKGTAANNATNTTTVGVSAAGHTPPSSVNVTTTVAPASPLMHNSDAFGSCSDSTSTNKASCIGNGGTWTPTTKWAPKGWGISGGQYGEFVCETCHTKTTLNIKRIKGTITVPDTSSGNIPGSTVNFKSSTTPDGYGNDAGGHATSQKVCEVCHTQTKFHRYDTTGQPGGLTHANNQDCTQCHTHKAGFRPSGGCDICHGYPPPALAGQGGTSGTPTGSLTAGEHTFHATASGRNYSCDTCHYNSVGTGATHDNNIISMGFGGGSALIFGVYKGGAYDGQGTANYQATDPATTVSKNGAKTCSSLYCHGGTMAPNGGTNTSPVWDNAATAACGTCHGASAANPPTRGSHPRHAGSAAGGRQLPCNDCHKNFTPSAIPSGMATHVDNAANFAFDTTKNYIGNGALYNGTTTMLDAYGNCSNVYCHSNVQTSPPGGAVTYASPTWGGTAPCGICHKADGVQGDASLMDSGSHTKHVSTMSYACSTCHNGAGHDTIKHADYSVDVSFAAGGSYSGTPAPGDGYGSCNNTYCHSDGTSVKTGTIPDNTSPVWGASTTCSSCHGAGAPGNTGQPQYATGSPKANSHTKHTSACSTCHYATTTTNTTITNTANHVNGSYNLQANGSVSFTYAAGSCSSISCHSGGSATWGSTVACGGCHAIPPATGAHAAHIQDANLITKAYGNTEVVSSQSSYAFGCGNCHPVNPSLHANGTLEVSLNPADGGSLKAKNDPGAGVTGSGLTTVCNKIYCHSNGAGGSGSNIASAASPQWGATFGANKCGGCHGNPPQYASAGAGVAGANSHYNATGFMGKEGGHMVGVHFDNIYTGTTGLATSGTGNTNSHGNSSYSATISCYVCHNGIVSSTTIDTYAMNGTSSVFKCGTCHTDVTPTPLQNGVITDKSYHVNGSANVVIANAFSMKAKAQLRDGSLPSGWTRNAGYKAAGSFDGGTINTADWNSGTKTCTTACHLSQPVTWGDTSVTCSSCHVDL